MGDIDEEEPVVDLKARVESVPISQSDIVSLIENDKLVPESGVISSGFVRTMIQQPEPFSVKHTPDRSPETHESLISKRKGKVFEI